MKLSKKVEKPTKGKSGLVKGKVREETRGRHALYKSEIHDKSILDFLSAGHIPEDFCRHWNICKTTYHNWKAASKTFKSAANRGKQYGMALWLKKPLDRQENAFSHPYWTLVMKNVYNWGAVKIPELQKEQSPKEIIDTVINLLSKGRIPERLADKFNALAMSKLRIIEFTELEDRIANLERLTKS